MKPILFLFFPFFCTQFLIAQEQTVGVFVNEENVQEGYTLFSPIPSRFTYLIDNCGRIVNIWEREYNASFSGYLNEDGHLIRAGKSVNPNDSQNLTGGFLEIIDWDNERLWSYEFNTSTRLQHHDFIQLPNNNLLVIAWERNTPEQQLALGRDPDMITLPFLWTESIYEIRPIDTDDMEIVWEWHATDHLIQDVDSANPNFGNIADNIGKIDINHVGPSSWEGTDWWHANAIDYNASLDQILLNVRNNNEMWIIDHSTTTEEAADSIGGQSGKGGELLFRWGNPSAYKRGEDLDVKLFGNHGTYWIPEGLPNAGNILYFNNGLFRPDGIYSTIEMINPQIDAQGAYVLDSDNTYLPKEATLVYRAPNPTDFLSEFLSNARQLPNGNILINEGGDGHLFEINIEGEIVWDYINPDSDGSPVGQFDIPFRNPIFRAYKYSPDFIGFVGKELIPSAPLEGESEFSVDCKSPGTINTNDLVKLTGSVFYDANNKMLVLKEVPIEDLRLTLSDVLGRKILQQRLLPNNYHQIGISDLSPGIYIINLQAEDGARLASKIWVP